MPQNFFGAERAQKGLSKFNVMPFNFVSEFIIVSLGMTVITQPHTLGKFCIHFC
jgi:hypothetical protein